MRQFSTVSEKLVLQYKRANIRMQCVVTGYAILLLI